jgi:hypothetical protein
MKSTMIDGFTVYGSGGQWSCHYEAISPKFESQLKPCPNCARTITLEICNTHSPSYWVACECGAEFHGGGRDLPRRASRAVALQAHRDAMARAIKGWNSRRDTP